MPIIVMAVLRGSMRQPHQFLARHDYRPINLKSLNRPRAVPAHARAQRARTHVSALRALSILLGSLPFPGPGKALLSHWSKRQKIAERRLPARRRPRGDRWKTGFKQKNLEKLSI
jgi:hypothetical protein